MEFWNNILHTALLGTDKKQVSPEELPPDLAAIAEQLRQSGGNREEQFLQLSSVAFNYRRCGMIPYYKEGVSISTSPPEENSYCPPAAIQALKDILSLGNNALLGYWLRLCQEKKWLVIPDLLPDLLQLGEMQKALRPMLVDCGGKRAQWLAGFNPDWMFVQSGKPSGIRPEHGTGSGIRSVEEAGSAAKTGDGMGAGMIAGSNADDNLLAGTMTAPDTGDDVLETKASSDEELWQTGNPEQRRQILAQLRQTDPDKAREWLQQTWAQEDANSRADLLRQLLVRSSEKDLPFLESLLTEKSKKVKEEAMTLLKTIPGSPIVQAYWNLLRQAVSLKKEKSLLGLVNKSSLQIALPADMDEAVFKSGIEKLSKLKTVSDEQYIIAQLIVAVPPYLWEGHFGLTPPEIVALFGKTKETVPLTEALGVAAGRWGSKDWAPAFVADDSRFYPDLLPLLSLADREKYLLKGLAVSPDPVIRWLTESEEEWSLAVTRAFFTHAAKNPSYFNRAFFNQHISSIPVSITGELGKFTAQEGYLQTTWNNTGEHISKLLTLKQRTAKAFNE